MYLHFPQENSTYSHLAVRKFWNMTPHPCRTPSKQRRVQCKDRISWDKNGLKGADTRRLLFDHICVLWETAHFCSFPPFSTTEADVVVWFMKRRDEWKCACYFDTSQKTNQTACHCDIWICQTWPARMLFLVVFVKASVTYNIWWNLLEMFEWKLFQNKSYTMFFFSV